MTEISKEWCINMAKQEEGDISAGRLAIDPNYNNYQKLPLNESFERVAQVAKERDEFNRQMREKETNMMTPVTDTSEAAQVFVDHIRHMIAVPKTDARHDQLLQECLVKLRDVQGTQAPKQYACNLIKRIERVLQEQSK